jgi:hypothetical protein
MKEGSEKIWASPERSLALMHEPADVRFQMSAYDKYVIYEIARHRAHPGPVRRVLELVGSPVEKLSRWAATSESVMVRRVYHTVLSNVEKSLRATVYAALQLQSDEDMIGRFHQRGRPVDTLGDVRGLSLIDMDAVAESTRNQNAALLGAEGAALGALATLGTLIPYAQVAIPAIIAADVAASMTLLSRSTTMIASSYGFPARDPVNLPHVLTAMAPTQLDSDEGFVVMKAAAVAELKAAGDFMRRAVTQASARAAGSAASISSERAVQRVLEETMSSKAPKLLRLINAVAARLGIVLTEKELGTLIPVAGAVFNSGLNLAFHQVGHTLAKDYFREQILAERYGRGLVNESIRSALEGDEQP